jgi:hypothetical protein
MTPHAAAETARSWPNECQNAKRRFWEPGRWGLSLGTGDMAAYATLSVGGRRRVFPPSNGGPGAMLSRFRGDRLIVYWADVQPSGPNEWRGGNYDRLDTEVCIRHAL